MTTKTGSPEIELKTDPKQITFKPTKSSVLLWRRILLLRYYINLGEDENVDVSWYDYDSKNKKLILEDETMPYNPIIPAPNLCKSITQINVRGKKLITFTLYYTTLNCLVQGKTTQDWVDNEFKTLSEKVKDMNKCKKEDIDQMINSMSMENLIVSNIPGEKGSKMCENPINQESDKKHENIKLLNQDNENPEKERIEEDKSENGKTLNNSTCSVSDDDILHALHNIETHNIDQSLSVQNGLKSVQTSSDQILDILQTMNSKIEKIEKTLVSPQVPELDKRLKRLEEKVDFIYSKSNTENNEEFLKKIEVKLASVGNTQSDSIPDCVKFVDSIIELTSKISAMEHKFEKFEAKILKGNEVSEKREESFKDDETITKSIIETSNKYDALQDLEGDESPAYENNQGSLIKAISEKLLSDFNSESETAAKQKIPEQKLPNKRKQHENSTKEDENLIDLWIIGSSVTRHINPKLMYKNKTVRITTLTDKTVKGAKQYIESGNVKA